MNVCEELDRLLAGGDVEVVWHGLTATQWRSLVAPYRERAEKAESERDAAKLEVGLCSNLCTRELEKMRAFLQKAEAERDELREERDDVRERAEFYQGERDALRAERDRYLAAIVEYLAAKERRVTEDSHASWLAFDEAAYALRRIAEEKP